MHRLLAAAVTALAIGVAAAAAQAPTPAKQRIAFKSHGLTLTGFLLRPDGPGPFPAIVWHHGSEKNRSPILPDRFPFGELFRRHSLPRQPAQAVHDLPSRPPEIQHVEPTANPVDDGPKDRVPLGP
jgi:hypothetical protein